MAARSTDVRVDGAVRVNIRFLECGVELVGSEWKVGVGSIGAGFVVTERFVSIDVIGCSSWYGASA